MSVQGEQGDRIHCGVHVRTHVCVGGGGRQTFCFTVANVRQRVWEMFFDVYEKARENQWA